MDIFLHKDIAPANLAAEKLAKAILNLIEAQEDLKAARKNVPSYTGQYDYNDYFAQEQDNWNRAADALFELICVDSQKN